MTSRETTHGQELIDCKLCRQPVSFFCRRCRFNLCDACVPVHLRAKSNTGHDVVEYRSKDDKKKLDNTKKKLPASFNVTYFIVPIILSIFFYLMYLKIKVEIVALVDERHKLIDNRVINLQQQINKLQKRASYEAPSVFSVIDTGFPGDRTRINDIAVTDDKKVWIAGSSKELKLFDLQGILRRTVIIPSTGVHISMYKKQVVFSDHVDKAVKKVSDDGSVVKIFSTGDWRPYGITGSASGDLLVCLKHDQSKSKVVRYSSSGTVLREIQYNPHGHPLYVDARYITENVNGDIIVTDSNKNIVTAVNRYGILRYTYSGNKNDFVPGSVTTDSVGQVMVTDLKSNKIHVLNRDGQFLRYIIPKEGIIQPRALAKIDEGVMIVGEWHTGLAKIIKF